MVPTLIRPEQFNELKKRVSVLWKQDFPRQKKILDLQTKVKELKQQLKGDISYGELLHKEDKKLLRRIVWIEKSLKLKGDKKILKKETKKLEKKSSKKALVNLIASFLKNRKKKK